MKPNHKMWTAASAVLGLALAVPNCSAQCGGLSSPTALHSSLPSQMMHVRLLPAAFQDEDRDNARDRDPIVGLWHVKFVVKTGSSETTTIDAGYAQWHSDRTEIMNSGSRPPSTSNFCLGVWEKVGERQYKLNHLAISWSGEASATAPIGPANIREDVTLDPDGDKFSGTFTIDQYDESLNVLAHVAGTVNGTRITVNTPPSSIF